MNQLFGSIPWAPFHMAAPLLAMLFWMPWFPVKAVQLSAETSNKLLRMVQSDEDYDYQMTQGWLNYNMRLRCFNNSGDFVSGTLRCILAPQGAHNASSPAPTPIADVHLRDELIRTLKSAPTFSRALSNGLVALQGDIRCYIPDDRGSHSSKAHCSLRPPGE